MLEEIDIPREAQNAYSKIIEDETNNNEIADAIGGNGFRIRQETPLQEFYAGQKIFITGGTGFLGKILIEKLLRSCPSVSTIYLLVRPKKEKNIQNRMQELFEDPIFQVLKDKLPKFGHKVIAIAGDCALEGLGLSSSDRELLINEVSIIFHVAATVRFDEKLKTAVAINIQSTADILELGKEMQKLKSLIHVSTAYANCNHQKIEEKMYTYPIKSVDLLKLVECMPEEAIDQLTPTIISSWPNTYAFTKAMAEDYVRRRNKGLPIGIFRPAIVVSTANEPIPGWIDNLYGPTGVAAGVSTGILRSLHCDSEVNANIVPVDLTVNALIASAWDVAMQKTRRDEDMLIYNFVSSADARLTWGEFCKTNVAYSDIYPPSNSFWYLSFTMNKHKLVHSAYTVLLHLLPALVVDTASLCIGQKPKLLKVYQKVHKFTDVISHFCTREWTFTNGNVQSMWDRLDSKDQQIFRFNMKNFNWELYFETYLKGIRVYLFKDDLSTLEQSKKRWIRFYWMHQITKAVGSSVGIWILWRLLSTIFTMT
ncbi:fatty acyl-CoA reductase wat-like [Belonocnema kinseyi]|uniref:fatty acyl-CoA reductase wat-like n=1 Tax=Belonocnema kinseyi TaxID=2817044 RepID=UPI00143CDAC3|nr:fatty acyl-CoA reductase wat-like [Belonocnema kinseyi]